MPAVTEVSNNKFKQLPNLITWLGCLLGVFCLYAYEKPWMADWLFIALYSTAWSTDAWDGWLARKLKCVSDFGMKFDPFRDKLLIGVGFFLVVRSMLQTLSMETLIPIFIALDIGLVMEVLSSRFFFLYKKHTGVHCITPESKIATVIQGLCLCALFIHGLPYLAILLLWAMIAGASARRMTSYIDAYVHEKKDILPIKQN